ncbi:hypothetical protein ANO11243_070960 [Dothideomycetidae sp. 11243]|nr:hypothetical protein ANO11243_070960 [fungal sp. No.11243]
MEPPQDETEQALQSLIENYHEFNGTHVDVLEAQPTPLEFMRYVARNKPLIIRRGARHWSAVQKWSAEYLVKIMGNTPVNVALTPNGLADAVAVDAWNKEVFAEPLEQDEPFSDVLTYITARGRGEITGPVKYCQTQNDNLRGEYSQLFSDVPHSIAFAQAALDKEPDAVNFWLGDAASITSLHKDNYENIYAQIRGRKHFVLLPPVVMPCTEERSLPLARYEKVARDGNYATAHDLMPVVQQPVQHVPVPTWDPIRSHKPPNEFGKYVQPIHVDLEEGDMMYLPAMWYDMDFSGQFWSTNNFIRDLTLSRSRKPISGPDVKP